jgi:hypothetical protein
MALFSREFLRRVFYRDRLIFVSLAVAFGLQVVLWALLLWRAAPLAGAAHLPLHYNIYFGVDLLGPGYGLFFPAGFGLLVLLLNVVFIGITYEWQRLLAHVFAFVTAFLELILLTGSLFIMLLNL